MRYPVLPTRAQLGVVWLATFIAAVGCVSGCGAHARQVGGAAVSPDGDAMVFRGERGQVLTIATDRDGVWSAVLEGRGERASVTTATCPEFASAMEAFRGLPGIRPGPYAAQDTPDVRPIPPTTKDGESWSITAPAFAPDWSSVVVTIEGDQGPYARWASSTRRSIQSCADAQG